MRKRQRQAVVMLGMAALALGVAIPASAAAGDTRIHDIQGKTRLSGLAGQQVADVPGVVTAIRAFGSARGFWLRTRAGCRSGHQRGRPRVHRIEHRTSVATPSRVRHRQRVLPDAAPDKSVQQSTTELTGATWTVESSGNALPATETVGPRAVPDAMAPDADGGNVEALPLRPRKFAIDYWESREGRLSRAGQFP